MLCDDFIFLLNQLLSALLCLAAGSKAEDENKRDCEK